MVPFSVCDSIRLPFFVPCRSFGFSASFGIHYSVPRRFPFFWIYLPSYFKIVSTGLFFRPSFVIFVGVHLRYLLYFMCLLYFAFPWLAFPKLEINIYICCYGDLVFVLRKWSLRFRARSLFVYLCIL
jgi:hypothetical protein